MSYPRQLVLSFTLLVIAVAVVYSPVRGGEFLEWDDDHNVYNNEHLRELNGENLRWMFFDVGKDTRYKALGWMGWAVIYKWFGLNAGAFHVANVLVHAVNVCLVFLLILRFLAIAVPRTETSLLGPINSDVAIATLAAALWALHPLRVEPVAWVTGFPYHLAMMFLLGALWFYLGIPHDRPAYRQHGYWLMLGCYLAAIMSYPMPIGGVAIFFALNVFPFSRVDLRSWQTLFGRETWRVVLELMPLVLISIAMLAVAIYGAHVRVGIHTKPPDLDTFPLLARGMQAAYVWCYYLWKPLLPFGLSPVYQTFAEFNPLDAKFLLSAVALVGVTWFVWQKRTSWPALAAFWIAHLGVLVPVLGINIQGHVASDRYSIIHGLLLSLALGHVLASLSRRGNTDRLLALASAAVVFCGSLSWQQCHVWLNNRTFFQRQLDTLPDGGAKAAAHFRMGNELRRVNDFPGAAKHYELAKKVYAGIRIPELPFQHGEVLYALGRFHEAIPQYEAALNLRTDAPEVWYGLAQSWLALGQLDPAAQVCEQALRLHPSVAEFHQDLAKIRQTQGRMEEAKAHAEAALRLGGQ